MILWCIGGDEFCGRKKPTNGIEIRSGSRARFRKSTLRRVRGQQGDLLILIDPALYAADVARAEPQLAAAKARQIINMKRSSWFCN